MRGSAEVSDTCKVTLVMEEAVGSNWIAQVRGLVDSN